MLIRDLFVSDVTRDIPPVVYFHEQSPEKLQAEVSEYIITGGWNQGHPNHRRVPNGIHEQYVRLLNGIAEELGKPGGPELPTSWISGFYGSGKSSFAKLLGLALDGVVLPDGRSLAAALLDRDRTPRAQELKDAWAMLLRKIEPIAVVFDIGGVARDNEHIHAAALRQVQRRLGYCSTEPLVADFELKLERDGEWARFERVAATELGQPWAEVKDKALAEEAFSQVMAVLYPDRYTDPMSWFTARAGTHQRAESPEDAVEALGDMLRFRQPRATLFLVIDEVSQYVLSSKDRLDRLRAFATALGARLKGKAWLLALGQQKLDEEAGDAFLVWAKDRFPPKLRVHLDPTNIRDVVHRRLLQKRPEAEKLLRELFEKHRHDLKLFAYGCENITPEEFVEVYPMLPGHIDLLLQITSALRTSLRAQGDDQAIRGLLQLLGELFRARKLADKEVGSLVTLDEIYEVQHTALDSDVQASMARLLSQCAGGPESHVRVAKAVALLELIQETLPTDARLVAQCLFDRLDRGSQESEVTQALEDLRSRNLLGYSEKLGYKIQSSAAEEWERERRDLRPSGEVVSQIVQDAFEILLASPDRPRLQGRPFAWAGVYSDGRRFEDKVIAQPREDAVVRVDFRFLPREDRTESTWVRRSAENALVNRLLWVCGDTDQLVDLARDLGSSRNMVKKYKPRRDSLNPPRRQLLQEEETRSEDLLSKVRDAVAGTWMAGRLYFRGRTINPREHGSTFPLALHAISERLLPDLYSFFVSTVVTPGELLQLVPLDLSGPPVKFLGELGILEMDQGRYVPTCSGEVPRRVLDFIETEDGLSGTTLLSHFGEPPYGYTSEVVKACVAGLLRASKVRIQPEGGNVITAVRDPGVRDLFEKDRLFRRAHFLPAGADDIGFQARARICRFFEEHLAFPMDREDQAIADAVAKLFPQQASRLREVIRQLRRIHRHDPPEALSRLEKALEDCLAQSRWTQAAVQRVKQHLDILRDGIQLLNIYEAELTEEAVLAVREAILVEEHELAQLRETEALTSELEAAGVRLQAHMALERPWRDLRDIEADVKLIRAAYIAERRRLLELQGQQTESARSRIRAREGFATLPGEQAHSVLRPLERALTETTADPGTIAPALRDLRDPFQVALSRAEEEANEILDRILSEGAMPLIVRVDLALHNREVSTPEDVEALVTEIRERLLEQVRTGVRVRLV
jgi:hypothetical protein